MASPSNQRVRATWATARWTSPSPAGALQVAANEGLDNLTFVVNANLQRLDGPVLGNGSIVQELESHFHGAGCYAANLVMPNAPD